MDRTPYYCQVAVMPSPSSRPSPPIVKPSIAEAFTAEQSIAEQTIVKPSITAAGALPLMLLRRHNVHRRRKASTALLSIA